MQGRAARWSMVAALALAAILHQDVWNWNRLVWVAGLPAGFAYHLAYCVLISALMAVLLRLER